MKQIRLLGLALSLISLYFLINFIWALIWGLISQPSNFTLLVFTLILAPIPTLILGYYILFGFLLFKMTFKPERNSIDIVEVFEENHQPALPGSPVFKYQYHGKNYIFLPQTKFSFRDLFPARFLSVSDKQRNTLLVYDSLKQIWLIDITSPNKET